MFPLLGDEKPRSSVLIPAVTPLHRQVVSEIGVQFRRELRYDFAPFDVDDPQSEGVLIDSKRFEATFPIAAGAAGLEPRRPQRRIQRPPRAETPGPR